MFERVAKGDDIEFGRPLIPIARVRNLHFRRPHDHELPHYHSHAQGSNDKSALPCTSRSIQDTLYLHIEVAHYLTQPNTDT